MRDANRLFLTLAAGAALAACGPQPSDQNVAIDINNAAPGDIEALPPDESVEPTADELANGDAAANADANAPANGY